AEAASKHFTEQVDVLPAGHAAQQDDFGVDAEDAGQSTRIPQQRPAIARLAAIDGDSRIPFQSREGDALLGCPEPIARRDDEDTGRGGRRTSEGTRIRELSPEVEAAQKGERLAQRHAVRRAKPPRRLEHRALVEEQARPLAVAGGRREDEQAGHGRPGARNSSTPRVLMTSPGESHPRRAMSTPQRTLPIAPTEWASVETTNLIPRFRASRIQRGSMSRR